MEYGQSLRKWHPEISIPYPDDSPSISEFEKRLNAERIQEISDDPNFHISYVFCTRLQGQTETVRLILKQGDRAIEPQNIRRIPYLKDTVSSNYMVGIFADFSYASFNSKIPITVMVIPEPALEYDLHIDTTP
jgi:hypothetical protein